VQVSPDVPAGHTLSFTVEWECAEGVHGGTEAFFVPVSAPSRDELPAIDLPMELLDLQTVTSVIEVPFDMRLDEVNVRVDITHSAIGDLVIVLIAPDGHEYRLHDRGGGVTDNLHTWYDTETEPLDSLDPLIGTSSLGTWRLRVTDVADKDEGTLDNWALEQFSRPHENPLAEVLLKNVSKTESGNVLIDWWPVWAADSYRVYRSDDPSSESAFLDITYEDPDDTDTTFIDPSSGELLYWIVSAVGHTGEGLWGHFDR
jgi:subtilisin-like proprotein convertase family protein